jgi:acyl carrier protein
LATVTLIGVVEEEFGIRIDLEDVEELVSFEGVLKHLQTPAL